MGKIHDVKAHDVARLNQIELILVIY
jgi:hypothetical protein